jgi:hypothetical protein
MRAIFLPIALAVVIGGCGYKSQLTLPKPKPDAQSPAARPAKPDAPLPPAPTQAEPDEKK